MIQTEEVTTTSEVYICDTCKKYLGSTSSKTWHMVTYAFEQMRMGSGIKIAHHFCDNNCLRDFLDKQDFNGK